MRIIKKILIANRGEIALRIQRTARKLNIAVVAIYTLDDQDAAFVQEADEAVLLPGDTLAETYLNIEKIIQIAQQYQVDAIHPGYGFLSENKNFIDACSVANIKFIGPPKTAVHAMGNKIEARINAIKAGVQVTPGITGSSIELLEQYTTIGFPILIKAAAGGGGKGMKVVHHQNELAEAIESTAREAKNYFGDDTIYMEKYIAHPRHIEVQVLGDEHGNMVHLFERECSIQRRHQKIIEEAPSISISDEVRKNVCNAAVQLAKSIGYYSAGTMEFLLDDQQQFYFLEMNTRIQVEHPVTEMITGIDIVAQQIAIAEGRELGLHQDEITHKGHAIECRIYAENPEKNFLPSPGKIALYQEPTLSEIRIDGMKLKNGSVVSGDFDPMIAKLIVHGNDRNDALAKMSKALKQYIITGIDTNVEFLNHFVQSPTVLNNQFSTKYIDENIQTILKNIEQKKSETLTTTALAAAISFFLQQATEVKNIWEQIGFWRMISFLPLEMNGQAQNIEIIKNNENEIQFILGETIFQLQIKKRKEHQINFILNEKYVEAQVVSLASNTCMILIDGYQFKVNRKDELDHTEVYHSKSDSN
ncbi:MAG: ATP-grasp domain-containing protein, partial [Chitinophagaceae bacterium]